MQKFDDAHLETRRILDFDHNVYDKLNSIKLTFTPFQEIIWKKSKMFI